MSLKMLRNLRLLLYHFKLQVVVKMVGCSWTLKDLSTLLVMVLKNVQKSKETINLTRKKDI